jgi:hypothetical protein
MLHRAGTMVLGEGVESEGELLTLMEADVDFVQGFCFGQPHASVGEASAAVPALIDSMWQRFRARTGAAPGMPHSYANFEETVLTGARTYKETADLGLAARRILPMPFVRRVFVVDANGEQRQPSIASSASVRPARFAPLFPDTDSNWSRRAYFKRALAAPERVAIMGPHYSLTEGRDCYTGAIAIEANSTIEVFCVDFVLDEPVAPEAGHGGE